MFLVWRISIFAVAYAAPQFISQFGAKFPYFNERLVSTGLPNFIWSFGNFDGVHYLGIAKDGYAYQFTQAFFPLYPILIRIASSLLQLNLLLSGLLVSNVAFFAGLVIFHKLILDQFDKKTAMWSVVFLFAFPTSFYFGAVYTEGLFFLLIMLSFYFFSKQKILLSSIFGLFASLTRFVGMILAFTIQNYKKINILPLVVVPTGLLLYMMYLKFEFNNAIYFLTSQSAFGQERSTTTIILLPQVLYRSSKQILTTDGLVLFNSILDLSALIFCLALLIMSIKHARREWILFSVFSVITPTLTGSLASMPRYILIAFPMFVVLARIKNIYIKFCLLFSSILLGIVLSSLFTRGYWIA